MRRLIVFAIVAWIVVGRSGMVVPGDAATRSSTQAPPGAAEGAIRRHAYLDLDNAWSVTTAPPLAFVTMVHKGLAVIDMTSPTELRQIGFAAAPLDGAALVTVRGYVYGYDGGRQSQIIDVREPTRPRLAGTFEPLPGKGIWGLGTDGTRLFVLTADGEVVVLDLTDPVRPRRIGQIDVGGARGFSLAYGSGYVYATTSTGISVVDVRDPTAPRLHATVALGFTSAILLAGEWLYVGVGRWWDGCIPGCWGDAFTLRILHVDDGRPTEVAQLPLSAYALDLALAGQTLFAAAGNVVVDAVDAIDVSDPARPRRVARSRQLDLGPLLETVGNSVLSSGGGPGLSVVSLESEPICPEAARDVGSSPSADRPTAARAFLPILAHGYDGCLLVGPTVTAMLGGGAGAAAAGNGQVFVGRGPRVAAYEVIAGQAPRIVGWSPFLRGNVTALATAGRYVYAGDDGGAVTVIDFADPATPRVTGSWRPVLPILALAVWPEPQGVIAELDTGIDRDGDFNVDVGSMAVVDGLVVLAGPDTAPGSLHVVDARVADKPAPPTTVDDLGQANAMVVAGHLALVADGETARLLDMSDSAAPTMAGGWQLPARVGRLAISDARAFMGWSQSRRVGDAYETTYGLYVVEPTVPVRSDAPGLLWLPADVTALVAHGDFAYAMMADRLVVIDARSIRGSRLVGDGFAFAAGTTLAIAGENLFAAGPDGRVARLSLSHPAQPVITSEAKLSPPLQDLAAAGSMLLALRQTADGPAVDILRPDSPSWSVPVATLTVPAPKVSLLAGADRRAYVMADDTLYAYDIGQPALPVLIARTPLPYDVAGLVPLAEHLAIATRRGGLRVVRAP